MRRAPLAAIAFAFGLVPATAASSPDPDEVTLELPGEVAVAVGGAVDVSLTVSPAVDRRLAKDASLVVELSTTEGLSAPARLRRGDAVDPDARAPRFELQVTGVAAGRHDLVFDLRAWSCGRHTCVPVRRRASISVVVTEPAPAPPPPPS